MDTNSSLTPIGGLSFTTTIELPIPSSSTFENADSIDQNDAEGEKESGGPMSGNDATNHGNSSRPGEGINTAENEKDEDSVNSGQSQNRPDLISGNINKHDEISTSNLDALNNLKEDTNSLMNILNHDENSEILHSDGHDVNSALKSSILNYMPSLKWLFVFIDN